MPRGDYNFIFPDRMVATGFGAKRLGNSPDGPAPTKLQRLRAVKSASSEPGVEVRVHVAELDRKPHRLDLQTAMRGHGDYAAYDPVYLAALEDWAERVAA